MKRILLSCLALGMYLLSSFPAHAASLGEMTVDATKSFESVNPQGFSYKRKVSDSSADRARSLVSEANNNYISIKEMYEPNNELWQEIDKEYNTVLEIARSQKLEEINRELESIRRELGYDPYTYHISTTFPDSFIEKFRNEALYSNGHDSADHDTLREIYFKELFNKQYRDTKILKEHTRENLVELSARLSKLHLRANHEIESGSKRK